MGDKALHTCESCNATFDLDQVHFEEPKDDNSTQYGFLAGNCPECGAGLNVTLSQLQAFLARPTNPDA